jgi:chaperonin cofactor prefoldin
MNLVERVDDIERRVKLCEEGLSKARETLSKVQGVPIIKATYGAHFNLDDNLSVVALNRRLEKIEQQLNTL